ncbi:putative START-like domain-containing protein [Rosa chinensis]|uniref:Putative START-like domain-containing protein n=1 Tax=Rosa chinensis TaxID=74649 RepID=A0A2P6SIP5_ROSCH|nr:putative START-like domain-containing protein [Rosa chinensis]
MKISASLHHLCRARNGRRLEISVGEDDQEAARPDPAPCDAGDRCSHLHCMVACPVRGLTTHAEAYKPFIKSYHVIVGDGEVCILCEVPAYNNMERLDLLDEESQLISFSMVGGDHRLSSSSSCVFFFFFFFFGAEHRPQVV